jgi:acyl-CoA synthetase (AMP-forming)/AMP-acid ligase II
MHYAQNLFPVQIENVLLTHQDIVEAAAVSVPDTKYGEVVGAWIVLREGAKLAREEVRALVVRSMNPQVCLRVRTADSRTYGRQNAPAWVWFAGEADHVPAELPKTASGKIQKHILRDISRGLAQQGLGKTSL